jgi:hypothetical protein
VETTFKDGTTPLGTGALSSGKISYTTATVAKGSHRLTANYGGRHQEQYQRLSGSQPDGFAGKSTPNTSKSSGGFTGWGRATLTTW